MRMAISKGKVYVSDILAFLLIGLLGVIFVQFKPFNETPLRFIFSIILILFIPGYALIAAMFPEKEDIEGIERFTLSFASSILILILGGFGLSLSPWQFRADSITTFLFIFTFVMFIIAYLNRMRMGEDNAFTFSVKTFKASLLNKANAGSDSGRQSEGADPSSTSSECYSPKIERTMIIVMVLALLLSGSMLVYSVAVHEEEEYTALYLLGEDERAVSYPNYAPVGETIAVTVGIDNHEKSTSQYILQMRLNNQVIETINVTLEDEQTWKQVMEYTPQTYRTGLNQLEFALFKDEITPMPYRSVHILISQNPLTDQLPSPDGSQSNPSSSQTETVPQTPIPEIVRTDDPTKNTGPTFNSIGDKTVNTMNRLSFRVSATDPDGDYLLYSVSGMPWSANYALDPETGEFSWTPEHGHAGTYKLTFEVTDGYATDKQEVAIRIIRSS